MNKALLIIAHGSRRAQSNMEIQQLAQRLAARPDTGFTTITHAFLELARPSIAEAFAHLAAVGTHQVVVVPYFLAAGRHVREDIPAQIATARQTHPQLDIDTRPYFGSAPQIPDLLLSVATHGANP